MKHRTLGPHADGVTISFPYDKDLVDLMRRLRLSRYYNPETREYDVPFDLPDEAVSLLVERYDFEVI